MLLISCVDVRDFIFCKERVVMVMDSSPLPGNKQILDSNKIEYVAVTDLVVQLL